MLNVLQNGLLPKIGIYKLEVWGAQGGRSWSYEGGKGGYSTGNIYLKKDQELYIAIGGAGQGNGTHRYWAGGWNGGGNTYVDGDGNTRQASGGGCTSITKTLIGDGQLQRYVDNKDDVVIVAGGGGGNAFNSHSGYGPHSTNGGCGGGLTGGSGYYNVEGGFYGTGATQTSGNAFGVGATSCGGSGGGWYGGISGWYGTGGGSGYIDGVENGQTIAGNQEMPTHDGTSTMTGNSGSGYAKITLLSAM